MDRWSVVYGGIPLVAAMFLMALPVRAQTNQPARPYRALFGGDASNQRSRHQLDLTVALNGGLDNGLGTRAAVTEDPDAAVNSDRFSEFYSAGAALAYILHGGSTQAGASVSTSLPYYSTLPDLQELAYGTRANISYVSGRTSVGAAGSYSHSPFYNSLLDPMSGTVLPGTDYGSVVNPNDTATGSASLARRFGRETSMTAGYTLNGIRFERRGQDSLTQTARISGDHRLSRQMSLTAGYGYNASEYTYLGAPSASTSHDADAGFTYTRATSRSKAFSLSASAGASLIDYQDTRQEGWRALVAVGQTLNADWSVAASYRRSVRFDTAAQEPVWGDDVTATAQGRIGRRIAVSLGAGYNRGEQISGAASSYETYYGLARLQVALAAFVAITGDYLYYRYDYPPGYNLPAGMPRQLDRQRILVGASFWLPLVRSGRARESGPPATQ
jgi:hypothetical protein